MNYLITIIETIPSSKEVCDLALKVANNPKALKLDTHYLTVSMRNRFLTTFHYN